MLVCLFVVFFWRAGTHDHKEDEIGNHVNFQISFFFLSRKHNTRKKERVGLKTDRLKIRKNFRLPEVRARTWRASAMGLSKTATFFV